MSCRLVKKVLNNTTSGAFKVDQMKIVKGNIIFTKTPEEFEVFEGGFVVVQNGKVIEVNQTLHERYDALVVEDFGDQLIIPGFVDAHIHAPQFENAGIGLDKELLPWLETYTFPEEAKFHDVAYAEKVYAHFVTRLWEHGTTRSIVFATLHEEATLKLMELFEKSGLGAYVGKVNMDRNSPPILSETTEDSLQVTEKLLKQYGKGDLVKNIITPRFVPTCTPELMHALGAMAEKYDVPIQSHLSENMGEIEWVRSLHPEHKHYADVYDDYKMFGQQPTIMAHCVHMQDEEIELMKENNVFVAHCPTSNFNLSSGLAPIKKFLKKGINVGIGTDVSGGHSMSMNTCIVSAVQASKMYSLYVNQEDHMLTTSEAFYLATKGGGKFFGAVGSFETGYAFDALVIDDRPLKGETKRSIEERLQRFIYLGKSEHITKRYVAGKEIARPQFEVCLIDS